MRRGSEAALMALCLVVVAILTSGCGERARESPLQLGRLPRLERVFAWDLQGLGPESPRAAIAVSPRGEVAFTEGYDSLGRVVTLVDTLGRVLLRTGTPGDGPGELRRAAALAVDDDVIVAIDISRGRILLLARSGQVSLTTGAIGLAYPLRIDRDSVDVVRMESASSPPRSWLARVSVQTLGERRLLDETFSGVPALVTRSDRIIVGDPYTYKFRSYDAGGTLLAEWGRDVPQIFPHDTTVDRQIRQDAARGYKTAGGRDAMLTTPERHYSALSYDGHGRLWTRGIARHGQKPFADIFSDTTFLGRLELPCHDVNQTMAFGGRWLALLCLSPTSDAGVELQLYRVAEPTSPG